MLTSIEPFLSAEIAYRQERMTAGRTRVTSPRRSWLRWRPSPTRPAPGRKTHQAFPAH